MVKKIASILACGLFGSIFSLSVQAFPVSSLPQQSVAPQILRVRGFCGLGFHRGPYGYCVRNGTPYGYVPVYPPPPPRAVGVPYACPFGFYVGPYGRCYQY